MCIMHERLCTVKNSSLVSLLAIEGVTSQRWNRLRPRRALVIEQRRGQERQSHACAASTNFSAGLQECNSSGDWIKAVELFAEVSSKSGT